MEKAKEGILPKIKVGLPALCKELNRLTGGSVVGFTGYYCTIYPKGMLYQPWNKESLASGERTAEKILKNCTLHYSLIIHRTCIVPERFGKVENDYPSFVFDDVSISLKDKLADGSHVYDHVLMGQNKCKFDAIRPSNGVESIGNPGARFLELDKKINPCLLNIDLGMENIENQKNDKAKTTLAKAICSLSRAKSTDGGKA